MRNTNHAICGGYSTKYVLYQWVNITKMATNCKIQTYHINNLHT